MIAVVLLGVLLGLDSLRASLGLGLLRRGRARRAKIALAFAVCDGLSPLVGLAIGTLMVRTAAPWTGWLGPLVLGGSGVYVLLSSKGDAKEDEAKEGGGEGGSWLFLGLPLALSLDNLIAGFGLGALGMPVLLSAAVIGLISGLMSLVGLWLGGLVGAAFPAGAERAGGVALTALAVVLVLDGA